MLGRYLPGGGQVEKRRLIQCNRMDKAFSDESHFAINSCQQWNKFSSHINLQNRYSSDQLNNFFFMTMKCTLWLSHKNGPGGIVC